MTTTTNATPTNVQQINYGFAPETAPYAQQLLGQAQALTDVNQNPYQQYQGDTIAQFSPLQQTAFTNMQNMQTAPQLQDASAMAGMAGLGGLNTQYTFQPSNFTAADAQSLMNPYLQASLAPQLAIQQQLQGAAQQQQNAQATQAGAFGGSRFGVQNAATNLNNQLANQNLIGQGYNTAFQNAQNQYNTQNQLNAQQQQFGAGLGMQGLNLANSAATNLANIGNTQYNQNMGIAQQQAQFGGVQQQQAQNVLNQQYQNFLNYQNYPYQQLNFMQNMIRGLPMTNQTAAVYQSPGSMLGQVAGLGIGAASALKAEGGKVSSYKDGGHVKGYSGEDNQSLVQDRQIQPMFYAADNPMGAAYKAGLDIPIGQSSDITAGIGGSHIQAPNFKMDEHGGRHIGFGTDVGGGRLSLSHYEDPITRYRENRLNYNMQFADGGDIVDPSEADIYKMMGSLSDQQIEQILQHPTSMAEQQAAQQEMSFRGAARMREGGPVAFKEGGDEGEETSGLGILPYLATLGPAIYKGVSAAAGPAFDAATGVLGKLGALGSAAGKGVGHAASTYGEFGGASYGLPAAAVLTGGYGLSDLAARGAKENEILRTGMMGSPDTALGAAIMEQNLEEQGAKKKEKQDYESKIGGGRGNYLAGEEGYKKYDTYLAQKNLADQHPDIKDVIKHPTFSEAASAAKGMGYSMDEYLDNVRKAKKMFGEGDEELFKSINDLIAEQKAEPEKIKAEGGKNALMNFGFQLAANAAQPGVAGNQCFAGLLRSAAAAGPEYAKSISDTDKMARDAQKLAVQLQIEQTRYQSSVEKGNTRAAVESTHNMQQIMLEHQKLKEMMRHNIAGEGLMGQRIAAAGASKNIAPYLRALAGANQQAITAARGYMQSKDYMMGKDNRTYDQIVDDFSKKFRKSGIGLAPTGNVFDQEDEES